MKLWKLIVQYNVERERESILSRCEREFKIVREILKFKIYFKIKSAYKN